MLETDLVISLFLTSVTFSAISNAVLRKFSKSYSLLMDQPDKKRKLHSHPTPLIGGLGIFIGILLTYFVVSTLITQDYEPEEYVISYLIFSLICLLVFIIDDLFNISPRIRLILQSSIVGGILLSTNIEITYLPDLISIGQISLGVISIPFTIFCCVGLMNAFNMIDGLNGLCAALAINALFFIFLDNLSIGPIIIIGAISGFIFYNIGLFGKKRTIFLGDSGSNFVGLTVAMACIFYTENVNENTFGATSAVTMLWFVALPLWDCIRVILTRLLGGHSALNPARDHIHHILLKFEYKPEDVLKILILISFVLSSLGIILENMYRDLPYISFYSFVFCSLVYLFLCNKLISIKK